MTQFRFTVWGLRALLTGLLSLMLLGSASATEGCWSVYTGGCPGCGRASGWRAQTISPGNCYICWGFCSIFLTSSVPNVSDPNITIKDGVVYVGNRAGSNEGSTLEVSDGLLSSMSQVNPMAATVLLFMTRNPHLASFRIVAGKMIHSGQLTASTFLLHLQGVTDEAAVLGSAVALKEPTHMAETAWSSSRPSKNKLIVVFRAHELDQSTAVVKDYYPAIEVEVDATGPESARVANWRVVQQ